MIQYEEKEILKSAYIDLINSAGVDGINAKLKAINILPIIAAPYTQLVTRNTDVSAMRAIAKELKLYLSVTQRSFSGMPYETILSILRDEWAASLTPERMEEIASNLSFIDHFDSDGYAVFKETLWDFHVQQYKRKTYRRIEYGAISTKNHYDFAAEPNVYNVGTNKIRIWTLNTENRHHADIMANDEVVIRNEYEASRIIHSFPDYESYSDRYFKNKNADSKYADWDHIIRADARCNAYWRFCKVVKKDDIIYLANGSCLYGYCIVTGEKVQSNEDDNTHRWSCKWTKFKRPVIVENLRPTPFFLYVDHQKLERIKKSLVPGIIAGS